MWGLREAVAVYPPRDVSERTGAVLVLCRGLVTRSWSRDL